MRPAYIPVGPLQTVGISRSYFDDGAGMLLNVDGDFKIISSMTAGLLSKYPKARN
jgi:hypothetical protein